MLTSQAPGQVAVASIGDEQSEVAVALLLDTVTDIHDMFVEAYWKDRNELLEMARGGI